MIGQLRGRIADKRPSQVLVDVGGVGYLVHVPLSTYAGLGAAGDEVTLLIHTHLREDQLALYGFLTAREKQCFELLITASGVGPALALKILSQLSLEELVPAVRSGDLAQLTRVSGVGRKIAERIVLDLRDKLDAVEVPGETRPSKPEGLEAEVASALVNLGYDRRAAEQAAAAAHRGGGKDFESLLRAALAELSGAGKSKAARAAKE